MTESKSTLPRDTKNADLAQKSLGKKSNETELRQLVIIKFCSKNVYYIIAVFLCFCALVVSIYKTIDGSNQRIINDLQRNISWDYLRFTQQWPPSVCITPKTQHCTIPEKSQFWTIHGLWPDSFNDTVDPPSECNDTWHFNETEILPIEEDMDFKWPALMTSQPSKSFWKHEWMKHGTCATILPELNTELKYFSKGLELRETYNLLSMLSEEGLKPDAVKTIMWSNVIDTFLKIIGKYVRVNCSFEPKPTSKANSVPLLSVVEICFDKNFEPFDCPDFNSTSCPRNTGIIFLPLVAV